MRVLVPVLVAAMSAFGCGRTEQKELPPVLVSPPEDEAATVALDTRFDGDHIVIDVLAHGVPDVHGIAFRVSFDPSVMRFASSLTSSTWSKQAMALAKEGTAGELAVLWTEQGELAFVDATPRMVLGTLVFDRLDKSRPLTGKAFRFRPERSRVMDRKGNSVRVAWRDAIVD